MKTLLLGSLATLLFVPLGATAHPKTENENPTASTDTVALADIVIVAGRATANTPVAFTDVTSRQLAKLNDGRDMTSLIAATPSIITTSDAGAGIGYSALRVRGTDASRINVTANGIPINDSESHNVYWVNMPDLASSLRDIQIQRGAGTSVNGAGAFGASINMRTDAPSTDPYAQLMASAGSFATNKQTVKVGTGLIADHWSADLRLSHIGSDGYIDRAFSRLWSYQGQLAWQGYNTSLRLLAFGGKERTYMAWDYASKEEMEKYGRRYNPCGKYTDADGNTAYYPDQCDNFIQHHIQLLFSQSLGDRFQLSAALHYTKGDGYYEQYKTGRALTEYGLQPFIGEDGETVKKSDLVRLKFNDNDFGGGTFSLNYKHGRVDAILGGAANWHRGNHYGQVQWVRNYIGPIDPLQKYYSNTGRKMDLNVYGRTNVEIIRGLSAYVDLQFRHIRYSIRGISDNYDWNTSSMGHLDIFRNYNFFNPKAGVTYTTGGHRMFASWSVAHKEPVRDNFTDATPGNYPNAERLFDYEIGYTYSGRIFTAGVNLYLMDYKDQLVATGELSDTGNPVSVNVPSSYRAGIELQAALHPTKWFEWQINATFSRNRIKDFVEKIYDDNYTNPISIDCGDTPIAFSPDIICNNSFNFTWKDADASLCTKYVSGQYMTNAKSKEAYLDGYCISDLHLGYTFKHIRSMKELRIGVSVYNIFNKKYCNNGYAGAGYYMDGGEAVIYRYAGYAAQATTNFMASLAVSF